MTHYSMASTDPASVLNSWPSLVSFVFILRSDLVTKPNPPRHGK